MRPFSVVIYFNIFKDSSFCLFPGFGCPPVNKLYLESMKKTHHTTALSQQSPFLLMLPTNSWWANNALKSWLAYWLPLSEWKIIPRVGHRRRIACLNACSVKVPSMVLSIANPTILLENKSSIAAKYSQPCAKSKHKLYPIPRRYSVFLPRNSGLKHSVIPDNYVLSKASLGTCENVWQLNYLRA